MLKYKPRHHNILILEFLLNEKITFDELIYSALMSLRSWEWQPFLVIWYKKSRLPKPCSLEILTICFVFAPLSLDDESFCSDFEPPSLDSKPFCLELEPLSLDVEPFCFEFGPQSLDVEPFCLALEPPSIKLDSFCDNMAATHP